MRRSIEGFGKKGGLVTRVYNTFCGMNPAFGAGGLSRLKNMYLDPTSRMLTSFVGFRTIYSFEERIHSIFSTNAGCEKERIYVHAGDGLYSFMVSECDEVKDPLRIAHLADGESSFTVRGNTAFMADGERLLMIKGADAAVVSTDERFALTKCLGIFDRRLVLAGGGDLSDRIFISEPFGDGAPIFSGDAELLPYGFGADIVSITTLGDELWVFLDRDVGEGSIICFKRTESGRYDVCHRIFSLRPLGASVSFKGEILFLTSEGLFSIHRWEGGGISILPRTKSICQDLAAQPISQGKIGHFGRYVLLFFGKTIYLGDTDDSGDIGYSWYPIGDVGSYTNDRRIYRYSTENIDGFGRAMESDKIASGEIFSLIDEDGQMIYYEQKDKEKLLVYPTECFVGGEFSPANRLYCSGERIWFSTEAGRLCLFNTDKLDRMGDGKKEEGIYTFSNHPVEYIAEFSPDDGGFPNMAKDSLPHSMIICAGTSGIEEIEVSVTADDKEAFYGRVRLGRPDFGKMGFDNISTSQGEIGAQIIPERAHRWREKQVKIRAIGYGSPIKIASLSHTFRRRGKIRNA